MKKYLMLVVVLFTALANAQNITLSPTELQFKDLCQRMGILTNMKNSFVDAFMGGFTENMVPALKSKFTEADFNNIKEMVRSEVHEDELVRAMSPWFTGEKKKLPIEAASFGDAEFVQGLQESMMDYSMNVVGPRLIQKITPLMSEIMLRK